MIGGVVLGALALFVGVSTAVDNHERNEFRGNLAEHLACNDTDWQGCY